MNRINPPYISPRRLQISNPIFGINRFVNKVMTPCNSVRNRRFLRENNKVMCPELHCAIQLLPIAIAPTAIVKSSSNFCRKGVFWRKKKKEKTPGMFSLLFALANRKGPVFAQSIEMARYFCIIYFRFFLPYFIEKKFLKGWGFELERLLENGCERSIWHLSSNSFLMVFFFILFGDWSNFT